MIITRENLETSASFERLRADLCREIDEYLKNTLLPLKRLYPQTPQIMDAVIYSAITTGGKRVRPLICYGGAFAFCRRIEHTKYAAAALELMHCYSLIHDDLPSMDDDDFRRNMPSCHKLFGEAHAILAGDIMQVIAFQQILEASSYGVEQKQLMTQHLAAAARDMVCGQSLDLIGEKRPLSIAEVEKMHSLKTAALITASLQLGAISAGETNQSTLRRLTKAGRKIGLAFQIQDDLLDLHDGKEAIEKSTYPKVAGVGSAHEKKVQLLQESLDEIVFLPDKANFLRQLFSYMVTRKI